MTDFKLILAALLFVGVTALKIFSPDTAATLRSALLPAIEESVDYRAAAVRLGENLTEGKDAVAVLLKGEWPTKKVPQTPIVTETPEPRPTANPMTLREIEDAFGTLPTAIRNDPEPEEEAVPVASIPALPEAMEVFFRNQEAYADLAIPANVSYDMPLLNLDFTSPIEGYTSSGFGYREHPLSDEVKFHYGTDFAALSGEPVLAFADGVVRAAGEPRTGYGKYLIVSHGDGRETLYAHLSEFVALEGQTVKKGQKIGLVGQTGDATGPHLHFELIVDGTYYNPEFYLNG